MIGPRVDMGAYEYGDPIDCDQNVFLHPTQLENVTDEFNTTELIFASKRIVSDDITFNAQLGVELGQKFEIDQGAIFQVKLSGCL